MRQEEEQRFRDFAAGRVRSLRRTAYLLCGDWHLAEDLAQNTLIKMYRSWSRLERQDELDGYVRRVLLRTWLDEKRRPWRRSERSYETVPDTPDRAAGPDAVVQRLHPGSPLHGALLALPPRQRATLVLRFFDDLSVAATAEALGCSEGNVKSQTARGLETLRRSISDTRSSPAAADARTGRSADSLATADARDGRSSDSLASAARGTAGS
jgi:RNA polymerase sigma-70 factor (sigma-E family)